jgi:hypothetical protein
MPRRSVWFFILINLLFVIFLINSVWTLLSLLVVDGAEDAISRAELPGPNSDVKARKRIIPKIIHQTYINESIPAHWKGPQQSCIDLHEDYEYKLWTDKLSREFIAAEYPWFLETFDGYNFPIQRADAIRYFVLAHYGGVYIDLDDVCLASHYLCIHILTTVGLPTPSRSPPNIQRLGTSNYPHRYLQRCHG